MEFRHIRNYYRNPFRIVLLIFQKFEFWMNLVSIFRNHLLAGRCFGALLSRRVLGLFHGCFLEGYQLLAACWLHDGYTLLAICWLCLSQLLFSAQAGKLSPLLQQCGGNIAGKNSVCVNTVKKGQENFFTETKRFAFYRIEFSNACTAACKYTRLKNDLGKIVGVAIPGRQMVFINCMSQSHRITNHTVTIAETM